MWTDAFKIKTLKPGRVLDGHVHDVLGYMEPVWPYSTHRRARGRLREWLKGKGAKVSLPGEGRAADDCVVLLGEMRLSFEAVSENHALCLGVLLTCYLTEHGRKIAVGHL
jgi:hypothetical protein